MTGIIALLVLLLAVVVGGMVWLVSHETGRIDSYKANCREAGGHIYDPDIIFCLDDQGRVVEVYP